MSIKVNCWDNPVAVPLFKTLNHECIDRYNFKSYLEAYSLIDKYINWYNYERLHSTLNFKTHAEK